ncbi:MAG: response regulator [Gemmatimonadales bacterium]
MARIVLIDDHDDVRGALRATLETAGHDVLEANDGTQGLWLLAGNAVDLVITDIFMPGQDGIEALRRIKQDYPAVKVIVISGGDATGRLDLREDALLLGAARALRKPIRPDTLLAAVEDVLGSPPPPPPEA